MSAQLLVDRKGSTLVLTFSNPGFRNALGPMKLLTILRAMQDFYGDPRYRPSPWLTRRAMLGVSLLATAR